MGTGRKWGMGLEKEKGVTVKVKRFDKSLPMPEFKTPGAAAFDLAARETVTIKSKQIGYISLNVAIEVPENCFIILAARSSTHKMGLIPGNGIGIMDSDYCGEHDEYHFCVYNYTEADVVVEKGTRVAQCVVMKKTDVNLLEVERLGNPDRGGFGTTGKK